MFRYNNAQLERAFGGRITRTLAERVYGFTGTATHKHFHDAHYFNHGLIKLLFPYSFLFTKHNKDRL